MNSKTFKNLLIVLLASVVLLCGIFWRPLFVGFVEFYFKNISLHALGLQLKEGELAFENGQWIIDHPYLTKDNLKIKAERILVDVDVESLSRRLSLHILVDQPYLEVYEDLAEVHALLENWQPSTLFRTSGSLQINKGTLVINHLDPETKALTPKQVVSFDIDTSFAEQLEGKLFASFNPEGNEEKHHLEVAFQQIPGHELTSQFTFQELSCDSFCELLRLVNPSLNTWKTEKGNLNGSLIVTLRENKLPECEGAVTVRDLAFESLKYGLKGVIQEASLDFDPSSSKSKLNFTNNASLLLERNGKLLLEIREGGGLITMHSSNEIDVALTGLARRQNLDAPVHIMGNISLLENTLTGFDIHMGMEEEAHPETYLHVIGIKLNETLNSTHVELQNIGQPEFEILQLLSADYPKWNKIELLGGVFNADMDVRFEDNTITEFQINQFTAKNLAAHLIPWNLAVLIEKAQGDFSINLTAENILETINAQADIKNGLVRLFDNSQTGWQLKDLSTHITVKEGMIQRSLIEGDLSGLKGTIELDWLADRDNMKCHFKGKMREITLLLSPLLNEILDKHFAADQIELVAGYDWSDLGGKLEGHLNIFQHVPSDGKKIAFGGEIEQSNEDHQHSTFLEDGLISFSTVDWISRELGIGSFLLHNGWFEAYDLPLEKYLSPLLFNNTSLQLKGRGDVRGLLDNQGLLIRYDGHDLSLKGNELVIELGELVEGHESREHFVGTHYIDFAKGTHYGTMPINNATYFEKNTGLLFTDIKAKVIFENKVIHIPEIETYSNGIYFAGAIDLDNTPPERGVFDLKIQSHTMHGKVSQIQGFFSHFKKPFFFTKIPLEGEFDFRKNGGLLYFTFKPGQYTFQTKIHGVLSDGSYELPENNVRFNDISFNIDYDHEGNKLDLWDIHGNVLVGEPDQVEEYFLGGDHIRFNDYIHHKGTFDLSVNDKKHDIIRLAGKTQPKEASDGENYVEVVLDQELTHFEDIYPEEFELAVKDWSEIDQFKLKLNFNLATLFQDIQHFGRTGLIGVPEALLQKISEVETVKGDFALLLNYDKETSQFAYRATADDVCVGSKQFNQCLLAGKKKGSRWMIEQLQLDHFACAADFIRKPDEWKINFLGLRYGNSLLLGLDGEYRDQSEQCALNVNLLEVDLSCLDEWPFLKSFAVSANPQGYLKGTGQLKLGHDKEANDLQMDADLAFSAKEIKLYNFNVQNLEPFKCQYQSNRNISLRHLKGVVADNGREAEDPHAPRLGFVIDAFDYSLQSHDWFFDRLAFSVPIENIAWMAAHLQNKLPTIFSDKTVAIMQHLKSSGSVNGSLNISSKQNKKDVLLSLDNDVYQFMDREHALSHFLLEYKDGENLKIRSQYLFQRQPIDVIANFFSHSMDAGELVLSTPSSTNRHPLSILWSLNPEGEFTISQAHGYLAGLDIKLKQNTQTIPSYNALELMGDIHVNAREMLNLLPADVAAKLAAWQLGKGYSLTGKWEFLKSPQSGKIDDFHFSGVLNGNNIELKGYEFQTLAAQIDCTLNYVHLKQVRLNDPVGSLHADTVTCAKNQLDQWYLQIPLVNVHHFRPSLLRVMGSPSIHMVKPFIIKTLVINDIQGLLEDPATLHGYGYFDFDNGSKRSPLKNTIFAIPAEIISRIGLNPNVMNPVTGTIFYEVNGPKIYLTKFKDVYSEGKLSRFYLSGNPYDSYIDFDGNLNLQVRMKQYNLLFKLAELLTVTVNGKLDNPTYSLQKQGKK